ncbi:hypothetical protein ABIE63_003356 [Limibacillus sp. MBR-115]|jgi:hypothetical protein
MCGFCGLLAGQPGHWSETTGAADSFDQALTPGARMRERLERVRQINLILHFYRLRLEDFNGASYILYSPTGAAEVVDHIAMIWTAADRLAKKKIDPFSPELLSALSKAGCAQQVETWPTTGV